MKLVAATVTVRMYNVGFGDCFLLTLPGPARDRAILIDCGRHAGTLQDEPPFWEVVEQLIKDLPRHRGGPFIDVLVMTHRHRDHVHGFSKPGLWAKVGVGEIWMPWTENDADPVARALREHQDAAASRAYHVLRSFGLADTAPIVSIARNSMTNQAAMDTLRAFEAPVQYLPDPLRSQATDVTGVSGAATGLPPGAVVHVLGPSRDAKTITDLNPPAGASYARLVPARPGTGEASQREQVPAPWGGQWDLKVGAYSRAVAKAARQQQRAADVKALVPKELLQDVRRAAVFDAEGLALSLDHALNGTSLVLLFEVGGLSLLFGGDAQWGTWNAILGNEVWCEKLKGLDFFKVGHHGSHNATPAAFVETYLQDAVAMVSVSKTGYKSEGWTQIPKQELLAAMEKDGRVGVLVRSDQQATSSRVIRDANEPPRWVEVKFEVEGHR